MTTVDDQSAEPKAVPPPPAAGEEPPDITADELFALLVKFQCDIAQHNRDHHTTEEKGVTLGLRGVSAHNFTVTEGPLNLTAFVFPTPVELSGCNFPSEIILDNARLGPLDLSSCDVPFVKGVAVHIDGNLGLRNLKRTEWIELLGAQISGTLHLGGSTLNPENKALNITAGRALNCNTAWIRGDVFLREGFAANGEVNFVQTKIGQLSCVGSTFKTNKGRALNCNGAEIGASVYLRERFTAEGEVNFVGAKIGGQLDCSGSAFMNDDGCALNCNGAEIGGSAFLSDGFAARGESISFERRWAESRLPPQHI